MKISVVTPSYRCSGCLVELCHRLETVLLSLTNEYEIIIVNDCSPDNDWEVISKLANEHHHIIGVDLSRNFGHQAAVTAGLELASGDVIVIMDADLQDPPEVLIDMVNKYKEGFDIVYAVRKLRKSETIFKRISAKIFYRLLNKLSEVKIPLDSGDFRLLSKRANDELKKLKENNRFIRGLTSWIGFPQVGIEYIRDPRFSGKSTYTLIKLIKFSIDGMTSFSKKPLTMSIYFGFFMSLVGFLYAIYAIIGKFIYNQNPSGWTTLIVALFITSGIQMIMLGVVGLYLGRIYDEAKGRPLFIVKNIIGKNEI